jgi:hypothetical protein
MWVGLASPSCEHLPADNTPPSIFTTLHDEVKEAGAHANRKSRCQPENGFAAFASDENL